MCHQDENLKPFILSHSKVPTVQRKKKKRLMGDYVVIKKQC